MTDEPSTHPTEPDPSETGAPAAVDPLDERLSAELDGESTPEPVGAVDVAEAEADDRRRALGAARDLLAVAPPALDDVTRRRMVRAAVAVGPHGRPRDLTWLTRIGKVAAALAVVVAGGLAIKALANSSGPSYKASGGAGKASSPTTMAVRAAPFDLHDVSNPDVLKRRVAAALGALGVTTSTAAAPLTAPLPEQPTSAADNSPDRCLATVPHAKGAPAARVLAEATYKGTPAIVAVVTNGDGTAVYVLARSDCRLLTYQFLKQ